MHTLGIIEEQKGNSKKIGPKISVTTTYLLRWQLSIVLSMTPKKAGSQSREGKLSNALLRPAGNSGEAYRASRAKASLMSPF